MGGRTSRAAPQETQGPPAHTEDTPHTEPTPPLVVAKHSRTLTAWLERVPCLSASPPTHLAQVAAQRRTGVPFRQPFDTDAVSYFELNFDIVHIVLSFLHPKVRDILGMQPTCLTGPHPRCVREQVLSISRR